MNSISSFLFLGGDKRQFFTAEKLEQNCYTACFYGLDKLAESGYNDLSEALGKNDAVILPHLFTRDNINIYCPFTSRQLAIDDFFEKISSKTAVFSGKMDVEYKQKLMKSGVRVFDYFEREDVLIKNAVPTAEGVISILINELNICVNGAKVLVVGYGRLGKAISGALNALNADVTCAARRCASLAQISSDGMKAAYISDICLLPERFDALINTVPARVINKPELDNLNKDCLIVETASAPYGIDTELAKNNGNKVIIASSLPGKVAPKSAGFYIADAILNMIGEEKM